MCTSVELLNQFLPCLPTYRPGHKRWIYEIRLSPVLCLRDLAWKSQTESCCRRFPCSLCPGACWSPHLLESSPVFVGLGASAVAPGALGAHPSLCLFQSPLALLCTFPRPELKHEPRINCFVSFPPVLCCGLISIWAHWALEGFASPSTETAVGELSRGSQSLLDCRC